MPDPLGGSDLQNNRRSQRPGACLIRGRAGSYLLGPMGFKGASLAHLWAAAGGIAAAAALATAGWAWLVPTAELAGDPLMYPSRGTPGTPLREITSVLAMKGITGCEEYSYKAIFPHEYSVGCWQPDGSAVFYNVYTLNDSEDVSEPYYR